jgi:hypothetical protein
LIGRAASLRHLQLLIKSSLTGCCERIADILEIV